MQPEERGEEPEKKAGMSSMRAPSEIPGRSYVCCQPAGLTPAFEKKLQSPAVHTVTNQYN